MITKNDAAKVFETILITPGMSETVKIDLKISRKNVLILSHIIEQGITLEKDPLSLLGNITLEELSELKSISLECLQRAGLVELNLKILTLAEPGKV